MNLQSGPQTKIAKVTFSIWLKTIVQLLSPQITTLCDRFVCFALYLPVPDLTLPPAHLIYLFIFEEEKNCFMNISKRFAMTLRFSEKPYLAKVRVQKFGPPPFLRIYQSSVLSHGGTALALLCLWKKQGHCSSLTEDNISWTYPIAEAVFSRMHISALCDLLGYCWGLH